MQTGPCQKRLICYAIIALTMLTGLSSRVLNAQPQEEAQAILKAGGLTGGVIVHIGSGDGRLTAALRANDACIVHGLSRQAAQIQKARSHILAQGLYGQVSVDSWDGRILPYIDNFANLVVCEDPGDAPMDEVMRVLAPNGAACIKKDGQWTRTVKPRPEAMDDWTHYLYDASNNAVSRDTIVGPPRRLQWLGSPRYSRHHDHMSSVSAVVSAGGRLFYIFDKASAYSILIPPDWHLIARDAFNGAVLWERPIKKWHTHLWPLKSGPAQLPRRLVASADRVYVTLAYKAPLVALDAATGETIRTYQGTETTEEALLADNTLFALVSPHEKTPRYANMQRIRQGYRGKFWDEKPRLIKAVQPDTGKILWEHEAVVLPGTLAWGRQRIVFHDGEKVICLNARTGKPCWASEAIPRAETIKSFYLPTLLVYDDVVIFQGGETAGLQTGSWYTKGEDTMRSLSIDTGKVLWEAYHPPSGYRSPEDLMVAQGLVWTGETTSGRVKGLFQGRDPRTGDVKSSFEPDLDVYWFHHRCYRGKATEKYLLMARTGTEFLDLQAKKWIPHHWVRGACLYGVMPANGLLYAPQNPCACYLEAKQSGFNAVAPAGKGPRISTAARKAPRLEKGPAYDQPISGRAAPEDWPTYRHDGGRSGQAGTTLPTALTPAWEISLNGKLTSPVIAEGLLITASVDTHTVHARDAESGQSRWQYTAGARIDSPPTIFKGRVLFGSTDGYVYCLRARDGKLAWRFRAAPMDQRLLSFEQVESVWPVPGSVLVHKGVLFCVAGRSMFLDDGLLLWRLDPQTGKVLSRTVLSDQEKGTDKDLHDMVSWLNMPPALPDILSTDGRHVYMRSQPFRLDGTRLPLEKMPTTGNADAGAPPATQDPHLAHLFSPTGFRDASGWHRSYWLYGSRFVSGWCGYYRAGKTAPAGKILAFDGTTVYGFGRKPQYYRWTTILEHQLFAAPTIHKPAEIVGPSRIAIAKSKSLDPARTALTVTARVTSASGKGVILAQGGGSQGYALYLQRGRPHFVIRNDQGATVIRGKGAITGRPSRVAAVLTAEKDMKLFVNGRQVAAGKAPDFVQANPAEALQVGVDDGSCVGNYAGPFGFKGLIDDVKVYHRALGETELNATAGPDRTDLVLDLTFDKKDATDASGHGNNGALTGVTPEAGAMRFRGETGGSKQGGYEVTHEWTRDLPILGQAMLVSGKHLFIAGPPDLMDEPTVFREIETPGAMAKMVEQTASINGEKGAILLVIDKTDGREAARYALQEAPVFDGMAAAGGRLYITTLNGRVVCMQAAP